MANIGGGEILFIAIVTLVIFGPKRLPEIGRTVGRALAQVRTASNEFKQGLTDGFDDLGLGDIRKDLSFSDVKEPLFLTGPTRLTNRIREPAPAQPAVPSPDTLRATSPAGAAASSDPALGDAPGAASPAAPAASSDATLRDAPGAASPAAPAASSDATLRDAPGAASPAAPAASSDAAPGDAPAPPADRSEATGDASNA